MTSSMPAISRCPRRAIVRSAIPRPRHATVTQALSIEALCEQTPGTGDPGTTQYWAKAYPGPRQLEVLEARGSNSILASICPRNTTDASAIDFGYRPAIDAVIERLAQPQP